MNLDQLDGSAPVEMYAEPERTSVAAILSLVLGILGCCGGLTSIFSILLGVFGIFKIKGSKGRVGGMGLAITGLLIGLLTLAVWIGLLIAVNAGMKGLDTTVTQPTAQIFLDIQSGNFDKARSAMVSPAADVSDEEMIAFRQAYTSTLGNYVSRPDGLVEYIKGWMAVGQLTQSYQGNPRGQGLIPMPLHFDNGTALVILMINAQTSNNGIPLAEELIIIDQNGNEYVLPAPPILPDP